MRLRTDWIETAHAASRWRGDSVLALARAPTVEERDQAGRRAALAELAAAALGRARRDIAIGADAAGAPLILGEDAIFASISHRQGALALALARTPIGVDIEPLEPVELPAWNVLHTSERAALEPLGARARHRLFLSIWTAKEAYLKALRVGLSREPATIASAHADDGSFRIVDAERGAGGAGVTREVALGGRLFLTSVAALD